MLLHKDGLIELRYEVANDVLLMNWPDLTGITLPEIDYSIRKIIDTLRHYDIKNLLIDSRQSKLSDLSQEEYQGVLITFVQQLKTTRLQRLARISTVDSRREDVVDDTAELALKKMGIDFVFRNFAEQQAAYSWLTEK
ncbi:hypothetical protein H7F15_06455 [Pontibacter sp. Tf4]|uniref:hypothetical protein n=1 Tax=Pontibacter sp. Tf4 TaxID=2761620 RepID=UPI001629AC27|nr:hypothetical protein [Pontibacter sp. Tf4]MBB6610671.1 hypothetical protein [Pontibacter sp. Tf4]